MYAVAQPHVEARDPIRGDALPDSPEVPCEGPAPNASPSGSIGETAHPDGLLGLSPTAGRIAEYARVAW